MSLLTRGETVHKHNFPSQPLVSRQNNFLQKSPTQAVQKCPKLTAAQFDTCHLFHANANVAKIAPEQECAN